MTKITAGRGRKTKIYHLNRNQAMLLITWLDNTETVRAFKLALVKRFDELEKTVQAWQQARAKEKPLKRELNHAINNWQNAPKFAYTTINRLLAKLATGEPIKAIRARDSSQEILLNVLTTAEQALYSDLENIAIGLIMAQVDYNFIKDTLEKIAKRKAPTATNAKGLIKTA